MSRAIVAILRGVSPEEVEGLGGALIEAGISRIEVPLNSPKAFQSIEQLARKYANVAEIGAGTVLTEDDVERVSQAGGSLIVSPNANVSVIRRTKSLGLKSFPGVLSPTECFSALSAGADALKFFPASILGLNGFMALKAVLPKDTQTFAVGGVGEADFSSWISAGVTGFGIGTALFVPGLTQAEVEKRAHALVSAYDRSKSSWYKSPLR
ncbi:MULTISPECIES: 2-dehydro-3-deoxy-6-phosphogalactonate aldolase [Paracoccaceae]|uniref:2-dehydro-3-deoxy-6-phosphogalactonate aldolase n=1 Tax=Flavimaricola marinus TaxID=1819565 RepID=A0A238LMT6_9RHOB|nr:2-dehydro-3-deoxy-6-phosphogalactonate aldolase [Flavimaricola marinus]SMY10236.1 2-dehydro-3-deoxy-6-phosphogalactonate aldolase [Flavimaricola marinus]